MHMQGIYLEIAVKQSCVSATLNGGHSDKYILIHLGLCLSIAYCLIALPDNEGEHITLYHQDQETTGLAGKASC